ncbi:unnamed protein product, partial [marine sediment metagenome]
NFITRIVTEKSNLLGANKFYLSFYFINGI